ncbi:hypothetical protein BU23DRAFT_468880, partial [Bimuria novae-zelandiae CBS 107.79]
NPYLNTLKKSRIKGACEFMDFRRIPYHHNNVFSYYGVKRHQGWEILAKDNIEANRTYYNSILTAEKRGRPLKLSLEDLERANKYL